ncbi:oligosaccharide flippase family protein, partial [Candidatus Woesearchaeota archaeon]|nr:oligosaccharide flippase family protein [Candidatus Woesearchaeota archaeon]
IGNGFSALVAFLLNALVARYLGTEIFGRYSFVFAFLANFMVLSVFGIDTILVREMSRDALKAEKLIGNAVVLKLFFSLAAMIISVAIVFLLPYDSSIRLGVIFGSLGLCFYSLAMSFSSVFQVRLEMIYAAIAGIASKLVFGLLTFYVILTNGGFVKLIVASSIGFAAQALLMYLFSRRRVKVKPSFDAVLCRELLREAWPIALVTLFITLYYRIDSVLLSLIRDTTEVGYYSAA